MTGYDQRFRASSCAECAGAWPPPASLNGFACAGLTLDLDDTLFPQQTWLDGAWRFVAARAEERLGVPAGEILPALHRVSAQGSAQGRVIDRALVQVGRSGGAEVLVAAFREYRSGALSLFPGVRARLLALRRAGVRTALVTDGFPAGQYDKIRALGLGSLVDAVVVSDQLGREFRKPRPEPFLEAARRLGVPAHRLVHVGDRPDKDMAGAHVAGLHGSLRVRQGEYSQVRCDQPRLACLPGIGAALDLVLADR